MYIELMSGICYCRITHSYQIDKHSRFVFQVSVVFGNQRILLDFPFLYLAVCCMCIYDVNECNDSYECAKKYVAGEKVIVFKKSSTLTYCASCLFNKLDEMQIDVATNKHSKKHQKNM